MGNPIANEDVKGRFTAFGPFLFRYSKYYDSLVVSIADFDL